MVKLEFFPDPENTENYNNYNNFTNFLIEDPLLVLKRTIGEYYLTIVGIDFKI